jgi:hypothetical protein
MSSFTLAPYQRDLVQRPASGRIFLQGPAGSGKTTTGVLRLIALLQAKVPASSILVLVPQRTLAAPYQEILRSPDLTAGAQASVLTVGGLARRMVDLFWPLVAEDAGFARPDHPPSFLTLETALYYMAYLVRPMLDQGLFDSVTIDRNRIYSQVIDNLNKSAIIGFPYTEIGERLRMAWPESTEQGNIFADAQRCASHFREYCLQNNLLDFSLQIEIFNRHLWPSLLCREYLKHTYCHLIADNLEEDTPTAHDLLRSWLPDCESALLIFDEEAGYRRFLGADPLTAESLLDVCDEHQIFSSTFISPPLLNTFCSWVGRALERPSLDMLPPLSSDMLHSVLDFPDRSLRFFPQMLDWVVERVDELIKAGTPAAEIVILAPLLPDSLRFALATRLEAKGIPYRSHRPSRALRDEPATQSLLALAALAHPAWSTHPSRFELAYALIQCIEGLDLVRAQLLVEAVYRIQPGSLLLPFDRVKPETQERITYMVGTRYETLRRWLEGYAVQPEAELDFFFNRLFGEVLSQPGFGFHTNYDAGQVSANLIESAQKFRWAVDGRLPAPDDPLVEEGPLGKEYIQMIREGILAAQYIQSWEISPDNAVLLAPAYTFLLANQPVEHQFWLDIGSNAWFERLYQPLTHPHILTREWPEGQLWTDVEEYELNRDSLYRLVLGLVRRCSKQIHLGLCVLNEGGYESRGMLLRAIMQVLHQSRGLQA